MAEAEAYEPEPCSSPTACHLGYLLKLRFVIHRVFACAVQ